MQIAAGDLVDRQCTPSSLSPVSGWRVVLEEDSAADLLADSKICPLLLLYAKLSLSRKRKRKRLNHIYREAFGSNEFVRLRE